MFDFNSEASISVSDLQVLCHLSLLSDCKIFGYFKDITPNYVIEITQEFEANTKIEFEELQNFCEKNEIAAYFFAVCDRLSQSNQ